MDTEPTYTTSNDIQYYRDTITIVTCFHTIVIVSKFHYRPALLTTPSFKKIQLNTYHTHKYAHAYVLLSSNNALMTR